MWPHTKPTLNLKLFKNATLWHKNTFVKVIWHLNIWKLFDSYTKQSEIQKIQNINDVRYTAQNLTWWSSCRIRSSQEINCFWRCCLAWILLLQDETLMSLFLWDNALQKLRILSHFAKWEPLICTVWV